MSGHINWVSRFSLGLFLGLLVHVVWVGGAILWVGAQDRAAPSDAIVVLGAAVGRNGPTPVFAARLDHGVALYKEGVAPKLVLTGGVGDGMLLSEAEVGRTYVVKQGVPASDVLIETTSRTTRENLSEARAVMQANALETAVLVSDPYHLRRAADMAEDLDMEVLTSPTPTTAYRSWRTKLPFLAREVYFSHHYLLVNE